MIFKTTLKIFHSVSHPQWSPNYRGHLHDVINRHWCRSNKLKILNSYYRCMCVVHVCVSVVGVDVHYIVTYKVSLLRFLQSTNFFCQLFNLSIWCGKFLVLCESKTQCQAFNSVTEYAVGSCKTLQFKSYAVLITRTGPKVDALRTLLSTRN